MSIVDSLRKLSLKLTGAYSSGEDIEDNIEYIAENYSGGGGSGGESSIFDLHLTADPIPSSAVNELVGGENASPFIRVHIAEGIFSNDVYISKPILSVVTDDYQEGYGRYICYTRDLADVTDDGTINSCILQVALMDVIGRKAIEIECIRITDYVSQTKVRETSRAYEYDAETDSYILADL